MVRERLGSCAQWRMSYVAHTAEIDLWPAERATYRYACRSPPTKLAPGYVKNTPTTCLPLPGEG